jgi:hypothetical protein
MKAFVKKKKLKGWFGAVQILPKEQMSSGIVWFLDFHNRIVF